MKPSSLPFLLSCALILVLAAALGLSAEPAVKPLDMNPPHISRDKTVKYDFDIVYVRAPRREADGKARWTEVGDPRTMEPGADLMLLHPDGTEEVLVAVKPHESITDPCVSFDGNWVYYAKFHDAKNHKGADIYKVHVPTRRTIPLTQQVFTPNTGAADWSKTPLPALGRLQPGAMSAAGRQAGVCQRPQRLQGDQPRLCSQRAGPAALHDGRATAATSSASAI